ncbi:unnamed protein product [Schistocephalus solidus]|uniref:C2H2-type domain-containing protein n=1 Tax=Schistocephalus solidus TaxID=70667 RepID=A0A183SZW0_SCHSO|nr:unnamed protein product [Schistocephalus solidus]
MEMSLWVLIKYGGQVRCYKGTLKTSLKQLQINPATWEAFAWNRPTWRRTLKIRAAIYKANRIAAIKTERPARKLPTPRTNTANAQALPTCPRCQRTFRPQIGLHSFRLPSLIPGISSTTPTIIETTSQYSSPVTSTTTATTAATTTSDGDSLLNCPRCDRIFTSRTSLHLRIYRTKLVNQCLEHQHAAEIAVSTALTVLAHSLIA